MGHFKYTNDELLKIALREEIAELPPPPEELELAQFKEKYNIIEGTSGMRVGLIYNLYRLYTDTPMTIWKFKKHIKLPIKGHRYMINWGQVNITKEEYEEIQKKITEFRNKTKKVSPAS